MKAVRVGIGIYRQGRTLHFDVPEMLDAFGWADTPENRDEMVRLLKQCCAEVWPDKPVIVTATGEN